MYDLVSTSLSQVDLTRYKNGPRKKERDGKSTAVIKHLRRASDPNGYHIVKTALIGRRAPGVGSANCRYVSSRENYPLP